MEAWQTWGPKAVTRLASNSSQEKHGAGESTLSSSKSETIWIEHIYFDIYCTLLAKVAYLLLRSFHGRRLLSCWWPKARWQIAARVAGIAARCCAVVEVMGMGFGGFPIKWGYHEIPQKMDGLLENPTMDDNGGYPHDLGNHRLWMIGAAALGWSFWLHPS